MPVLTVKDEVPYAMDEVLTRAKFEELIQDLVERTHEPIKVVLSDSGISAGELDKILLVGGSTRVPLVRRDIESYFDKKPEAAVDPDYAVAQGGSDTGSHYIGADRREQRDCDDRCQSLHTGCSGDSWL